MSSFGRFGKNRDHAVGEFTVCIKVSHTGHSPVQHIPRMVPASAYSVFRVERPK